MKRWYNGYRFAPYRGKGLPIHLVGLSFDSKTRHLADATAASA